MVMVILDFRDEIYSFLFNQSRVIIYFPSTDEVDFIHLEDGQCATMGNMKCIEK